MADIETYVDEMVMKFITGREPIEDWDTYVAKVKEMGIENVIGISQEALDAWNSWNRTGKPAARLMSGCAAFSGEHRMTGGGPARPRPYFGRRTHL